MRYELGPPETMAETSAETDQLGMLKSAYVIYRRAAKRYGEISTVYEKGEALYGAAAEIVAGLEWLKPTNRIIKSFVEGFEDYEPVGSFISAVFNLTETDELFIRRLPYTDFLGYRLGKGKTLVIADGCGFMQAGEHAEGNIYSWGRCSRLASHARAGFQGSWGKCMDFASSAEGGMQAVFGSFGVFGYMAAGGTQVNFSITAQEDGGQSNYGSLGLMARGGLQINAGLTGGIGETAYGGTQINLGDDYGTMWTGKGIRRAGLYIDLSSKSGPGMESLKEELLTSLSGLKSLKKLKFSAENIEAINRYDFILTGKRITEAAGKVAAYGRRT